MISERAYTPVEVPEPAIGAQEEGAVTSAPVEWGLAKRTSFRFACAYFFLYIFPFPLDYIPFVDVGAQKYYVLWQSIVPWVGKQVFGVDITVFTNGSGDTTYDYVRMFCYAVLAAAAALVWSLLDRRRANYARLHEWLRVYVRFFLAASMVSYGGYKIIPSQFVTPSLDRLLQPFGDASPMGLLWTFIGASKAYTIFSGVGEMIGGLLLIARRTTLLGALVCIGVLSNVVMLNFSYDVPVKLYSSHLLLMAVFLVLPDLRRLANLLVLNRPAPPAAIRPLFRRTWLHRGAFAFRTVLVLYIAGMALFFSYKSLLTPKSPLYGIWNVDEFVIDGKPRPPLVSDESRWRWMVFDYPGILVIQLMSQSRERYWLKLDEKARTFELTRRGEQKGKFALSYERLGPGRLALAGTIDGRKVRARLRRVEPDNFRLINRGFHWINEYPFNR